MLPLALERGMGVLAMKSMGGEGEPVKKGTVTAKEALGYAMSLPVSTVVSGIDSIAVLHQNLSLAGGIAPWPEAEMRRLRDKVAAFAGDGRFELFKTSKKNDGGIGRAQHGFPSPEELPR